MTNANSSTTPAHCHVNVRVSADCIGSTPVTRRPIPHPQWRRECSRSSPNLDPESSGYSDGPKTGSGTRRMTSAETPTGGVKPGIYKQ
jgi:hypothetical protein